MLLIFRLLTDSLLLGVPQPTTKLKLVENEVLARDGLLLDLDALVTRLRSPSIHSIAVAFDRLASLLEIYRLDVGGLELCWKASLDESWVPLLAEIIIQIFVLCHPWLTCSHAAQIRREEPWTNR